MPRLPGDSINVEIKKWKITMVMMIIVTIMMETMGGLRER